MEKPSKHICGNPYNISHLHTIKETAIGEIRIGRIAPVVNAAELEPL